MGEPPRFRVLVVDDSAQSRRVIREALARDPGVEVVGTSSDGEDALRQAAQLRPDVILLDLQMPRMDGFTFLRILMSRIPTPVIVVSSYSAKDNVFKALELGAFDFVARSATGRSDALADAILEKIELVRHLEPRRPRSTEPPAAVRMPAPVSVQLSRPRRLVAVAASTGGPAAIGDMLGRVPKGLPAAFVIVQHMPETFTKTFAERLDRRSALRVREAADGDEIHAGTAWVAPGRRCMEVVPHHGGLRILVREPAARDRYVPSADRLFASAAHVMGEDVMAVVLTGMGDDGREGLQVVKEMGGRVLAEAPDTAVIFGMPGAAVRTGCVDRLLPLGKLIEAIEEFARRGK